MFGTLDGLGLLRDCVTLHALQTCCTSCTSRSAGNTASRRMESGGATRLTPNRHSQSVEAPQPHQLPRRHALNAHRVGGVARRAVGARRRRASRVAVRRDAEQWAPAARRQSRLRRSRQRRHGGGFRHGRVVSRGG